MERIMLDKERAKEIRKILKANFKNTKFSVRSKNSINIEWTNGPTKRQVEKLVNKFEVYQRCEATGEILAGGNTFIFCTRNITEDIKIRITDFVNENIKICNVTKFELERIKGENYYNIVSNMDLTKEFKINENNGSCHEMYVGNLQN